MFIKHFLTKGVKHVVSRIYMFNSSKLMHANPLQDLYSKATTKGYYVCISGHIRMYEYATLCKSIYYEFEKVQLCNEGFLNWKD